MSTKIKILQILPATNWWAEFQEKDGVIHYVPVAIFALREITNHKLETNVDHPIEEIVQDCVPVFMCPLGEIDIFNTYSLAGFQRYFYSLEDPRNPEYVIGMIE